MASGTSNRPKPASDPLRRKPERPRGERRVAELLTAAEATLVDLGYEATTLREISRRAGASMGTVYQYYPNKESLVRALRTKYGAEMEARFAPIMEAAPQLSVRAFAEQLIDILADYLTERPAFVPLTEAPRAYKRSPEARSHARLQFARVFQSFRPSLPLDEAIRIANVTLHLLGGLFPLQHSVPKNEREAILAEFRTVLASYLTTRLKAK